MLVQTYRREVPGSGAFIERTLLREARFCVAVVRARGIVLDRGVLDGAVKFTRYFRRPQLSLVLEGSGYFDCGGRIVSFGRGDLVETHQRTHAAEGYGGRATEVIIVDWEGAPGAAGLSFGSVGRSELAALRDHVTELGRLPARAWVDVLVRRLRSLGLPVAEERDAREARSPAKLVELYASLGNILSRLDQHPSLGELASELRASERQTKRRLAELQRSFGHPFASWRDFLHEMRLDWATQLLSIRDVPLERVASLAGYRSAVALHHAFSTRGAATPRTIARRLHERWG